MHASRLHVQVCATGMLGNISIYTGIFEQNLPLPMGQLQEGSIQLRDCFQARGQSPTTKLPCRQAQPQNCATAHLYAGPDAESAG